MQGSIYIKVEETPANLQRQGADQGSPAGARRAGWTAVGHEESVGMEMIRYFNCDHGSTGIAPMSDSSGCAL